MVGELKFEFVKKFPYGENPGQEASLYESELNETTGGFEWKVMTKIEPGYNNFGEALLTYFLLNNYFEKPTAVVAKHGILAGFAYAPTIEEASELSVQSHPRANFGGVEAFNRPVTKSMAAKIQARGLKGDIRDVVIAPGYEDGAVELIAESRRGEGKKKIKVISIPKFLPVRHLAKEIGNVRLESEPLKLTLIMDEELSFPMGRPDNGTVELLKDLYRVSGIVPSNAIVIGDGRVKGETVDALWTHGIASSIIRSGAAEVAVGYANNTEMLEEFGYPAVDRTYEALAASDGFFPFRDSVDVLGGSGIRATISGAGALRQEEVLAAAKKYKMNLILCSRRVFRH